MSAPRLSPRAVAGVLALLLLSTLAAAPAAPAVAPNMQGPLTPTPTPTSFTGGGIGPGSSSGDPHLHTPDGLAYDFQAVGEFIGLKSTADDLEVQLRQEPAGASTVASMNTAAATNVAGDRVGVYVEMPTALRVNGQPTTLDGGSLSLPHGGRVERQGARYVIVWPDQTVVEVTLHSQYLDVVVRLASARAGQVGGLLGNADGSAANDLTTRGGTVVEVAGLAAEATRARLYGEFGDSWRITQAESLFDYGPGEDTRTYTRPDFPSAMIAAGDLPAMARGVAEAVCRQAGVTEARFLADCVLDIGVTGNAEFAASAAAVEAAFAPTDGDAGLVGGLYRGQIPGEMSVSPESWGSWLQGGQTAVLLHTMSVEIRVDPTSQPTGDGMFQYQVTTGGALAYRAEVTYDTAVSGTWITEESFTGTATDGYFYTSPDATFGYIGFDGDATLRWLAGRSDPPEMRSLSQAFGFTVDDAGQLKLCLLDFVGIDDEPDLKPTSQRCAANSILTLQPVVDEEPV
jgi:hypothetical protein